jgi:hypothetical protein
MCAIARGYSEIITELLGAGAKTDLRDDVCLSSAILAELTPPVVWKYCSDLCNLQRRSGNCQKTHRKCC